MRMLEDRRKMKSEVVRVDTTLYGPGDSNPLKFSGDASTAIETLLRDLQEGQSPASQYGEALNDLRLHQAALVGAIQKALVELLSELSPDAIEQETKRGSGLRFGAGNYWSEYCDRWDELMDRPNGLLDGFIDRYSKHYEASVSRGKSK